MVSTPARESPEAGLDPFLCLLAFEVEVLLYNLQVLDTRRQMSRSMLTHSHRPHNALLLVQVVDTILRYSFIIDFRSFLVQALSRVM